MNELLLTIAIPTYNRQHELASLLAQLEVELENHGGEVEVLVSNNSSTDKTSSVVSSFAERVPYFRHIDQSINVGMDGNFAACALLSRAVYVWIIGDDDLPRPGIISHLLSLLKREQPDLIYMNSRWAPDIHSASLLPPLDSISAVQVNQEILCRRAGVWLTYLSATVVRKTKLMEDAAMLEKYRGTHLTHLAWVLDAIKFEKKLIHIESEVVLATAGNSGGYKVLEVFAQKFPDILFQNFGQERQRLVEIVLRRTAVSFLPRLLRALKRNSAGSFEKENGIEILKARFARYFAFPLILKPIAKYPAGTTIPFILFSDSWNFALKLLDRFYEFRTGGAKQLAMLSKAHTK